MKSNFQRAKKNIFWSFISVLSKLLAGFAISILIARAPGVEVYEAGQILYAISLAVVISLFVDYGIDTYLIKEIAAKKIEKNELSYISGFRVFLGIIVFFLFYCILLLTDFNFQEIALCLLIGAAYIVNVINRTYLAYFQSQHEFKKETSIAFISSVLLIIFIVISLYGFESIVSVGYSYFFARLLSLLMSMYYISKSEKCFLPKFNFNKFQGYFVNSFSFGLLAIVATTCIYLDTLLLRFLTNDNPEVQVAYFQIAMQFVMAATLIPGIIGKGLLPVLSSSDDQDATYFSVNNILMTTGVLVAIFVSMYSEKLILFVYGEKYLMVANALEIVSIVIMMRFGMMYNLFLTIKGNNWFRVLGSLAMLITGVIANFILVPLYGFEGSAISSIFSHIAIWFVYLYAVKSMGYSILLGWNFLKAFFISTLFIMIMFVLKSYEIYYVLPLVFVLIVLFVLFVMTAQDKKYIFDKVKFSLKV